MDDPGDPAFQRREWRAQRAGWGVLAFWVAAAALGVTGPGPCSGRTLEAPDQSLSVRFEAVAHRDAPTLWRVESERAIAWLAIAGGRGMQVEAQPPNATRESRADGALVLRFAPAAPSAIDLEVVLRDSGWSRRRLEIEGAAPLHVEQLVLP